MMNITFLEKGVFYSKNGSRIEHISSFQLHCLEEAWKLIQICVDIHEGKIIGTSCYKPERSYKQ